jgi:hypothetical protein
LYSILNDPLEKVKLFLGRAIAAYGGTYGFFPSGRQQNHYNSCGESDKSSVYERGDLLYGELAAKHTVSGLVELSFDFAQDSELVELLNYGLVSSFNLLGVCYILIQEMKKNSKKTHETNESHETRQGHLLYPLDFFHLRKNNGEN